MGRCGGPRWPGFSVPDSRAALVGTHHHGLLTGGLKDRYRFNSLCSKFFKTFKNLLTHLSQYVLMKLRILGYNRTFINLLLSLSR